MAILRSLARRQPIARRASARRSAVLIECAMVFPFLILLLIGVMHYGWILLKASEINNAARNGARIAALATSGSQANAQTAVQELLNNAGITVYDLTFTPADTEGVNAGELITVNLSVPYDGSSIEVIDLSPSSTILPGSPAFLTASVTMAKE